MNKEYLLYLIRSKKHLSIFILIVSMLPTLLYILSSPVQYYSFSHIEMGGIKLETGYTFNLWSEGYGVNNVKISNNTFDTVNPTGTRNQNFERDIFIGTYLKRDPSTEHTSYPILSNILIEKNVFKDTFGLCAYIASAGNVIVRDNSFVAETARNNPLEYRGGFKIQNSENIKIVNNRYTKSPLFKKLGVTYDTRTSKKIIVEGNTLE